MEESKIILATPVECEPLREEVVQMGIGESGVSWAELQPELDEIYKVNAQTACANCPGFCCLTFSLPHSLTWMKNRVRELETEAKRGTCSDEAKAALKDHARWVELLVPVRLRPATAKFYGLRFNRRRDNYVTCKAFDRKTRRCTCYDNRPYACPTFICDEARHARGGVPTHGQLSQLVNNRKIYDLLRKAK